MSPASIAQPFVIHLGVGDRLLTAFQEDARALGMSVIPLDISGLTGREALAAYLAKAFLFPHEARGLDAAVDLISDLDWFGNAQGYLVVAHGLAEVSATAEAFVSILPNIVDRWRSKSVPFVVVIDGKGDRLQSVLRAANREMERSGDLPWAQAGTGAVEVIVHVVEGPEHQL